MKKFYYTIIFLTLLVLISCNNVDFSNPEEVINGYRKLSAKNENEKLYDNFLSSKSKEFVTKDEFVKYRSIPDSVQKLYKVVENKVSSFPIDISNPTYRRFKVIEKYTLNNDTLQNMLYYSLQNENGNWKVVWTATLLSFAKNKYHDGNYSEARKILEKIIGIDPYSGVAYNQMAWCYYRDQSITQNEWEDGIVKNAKYALILEEDNPFVYNTLGAYYSAVGNEDLAIQNYHNGLNHCLNESDMALFYSNLVGSYIVKRDYNKAENYIKMSIELNDEDTFVWYKYGLLMYEQGNNKKAIEYLENALSLNKMENSLQGGLYYLYALTNFDEGYCEKALEHINKSLVVEPDNYSYQRLYKKILNCSNNL